jgi:hypothetical protein
MPTNVAYGVYMFSFYIALSLLTYIVSVLFTWPLWK